MSIDIIILVGWIALLASNREHERMRFFRTLCWMCTFLGMLHVSTPARSQGGDTNSQTPSRVPAQPPSNTASPVPDQPALKPAELDALVAPIALYPDALLANVLMASTYPLEVVRAERWVSQNKNLTGDALKAMTWFIVASLVSLAIGLALVELIGPGVGLHLKAGAGAAADVLKAPPMSVSGFLTNLVPTSILDAMARNEVLQIVVFSLIFWLATGARKF